jgi:DNA recombination protein RmuC
LQSIIYLQQSNPYLFPILLLLAIVGIAILAVYSIRKSNLVKVLNSDLLNNEHTFKELEEKVETLGSQLNINRESVLELTADKKGLETLIHEKDKLLNSFETQISEIKSEHYDLQSSNINKEKIISELQTTIEKDKEINFQKLQILEEAKEKLSLEFQNLGNKIFEDKSKKFTIQNKENLESVLNPLKEQIKDFDKKVSDTYEKETKERVSLVNQIEQLKSLNEKISQDAVNLANALKTETKTQGTWGEFVLEKVLEISGLEKGREFETQETFRDEEGRMFRPDVVVHLPDGKDVVIDSKVSLTAYERYSSSEDEREKSDALSSHVQSIQNHIKELGNKKYEELKQINTLNYILMFLPIEAAYLVAIEADKELLRKAFEKNIIIVCPSTLLSTLRTIQSIWQFEHQNKNAQKIADEAGKMYDRLVDFTVHLENIGNRLSQASISYESAMKTLSTGKGNVVKKAEDLRKLGIKNKKSISNELTDNEETLIPEEPDQKPPLKFPYQT